jgi:hypothetical protein
MVVYTETGIRKTGIDRIKGMICNCSSAVEAMMERSTTVTVAIVFDLTDT